MDIERVNDHTIKFYIPFEDIEARGYSKDEIWLNRDRGEELFWDILDDIDESDEFELTSPLWIQVHALEEGLEVFVVCAQETEDGEIFEIQLDDEFSIEVPINDKLDDLLEQLEKEQLIPQKISDLPSTYDDIEEPILVVFKDFEDVLALASDYHTLEFNHHLFTFEERYYLVLEFPSALSDREVDSILSVITEYGEESMVTQYRLQEYGKCLIKDEALSVLFHTFFKSSC